MGPGNIPKFYEEYEESVAWPQPMLALIRWDLHHQQMIQPGIKFKLLCMCETHAVSFCIS